MKNSKSKNTIVKVNKLNDMKAAFLAKRAQLAEKIQVEKEEAKSRRSSTVKHLGKEDFLRLQILNAGDKGISVNELVESGKSYTNRDGDVKPISAITVRHNWNRKSDIQRGEEKLTKSNLPTEEQTDIIDVMFDIEVVSSKEAGQKLNNLCKVVDFSIETLKEYLISQGATAEMFAV